MSSDRDRRDDEVRDFVGRRVRRAVGLKVLRDLGRESDEIVREHEQRPRVALRLLALIVVLALLGAVALGVYYGRL